MKNNFITLSTVLAMVASSCTQKSSNDLNPVQINPQSVLQQVGWHRFQSLVKGENPNIALAEALSSLLQEQSPQMLAELRRMVENGELKFKANTEKWNAAKNALIVGNSSISADTKLLESTLNLNPDEIANSNSFSTQLNVKVYGLIQSIALQNILQTYDNQIKADSLAVAKDIATRLSESNPEILTKIDKTKSIKDRSAQIEQITLYLKQADKLFVQYNISDAGAAELVLYTATAGAMASVLAQQPSVKSLIDQTVKLVSEVKDLSDKANRIIELTKSVKKDAVELSENAKAMATSIENLYKNMNSLHKSLPVGMTNEDKKNATKMLNDLINGSDKGEVKLTESQKAGGETADSKEFFQKSRKLNSDITQFIDSAKTATESLDRILDTSLVIANTLGVKVSPKVMEAINTAQKISSGVKIAQAVTARFTSGGFIGAMSAFSGGPATLALAAFGGGLGAGGPDPAIMSELGGIKESLSEIKELQLDILEKQKQTMSMIKDLALLVEENHKEEMQTLIDIRDELGFARDAISDLAEDNFYKCQVMSDFAMHSIGASSQRMRISNLENIQSKLRQATSSEASLHKFIDSTSSTNFDTCQQELGSTFAMDTYKFNRTAWIELDINGYPSKSGAEISKKFYEPAYLYLDKISKNKDSRWQKMALHLPVLTVSSLIEKKSQYLDQPSSNDSTLMELFQLTATNKLEKYATALIVLWPYLAVDHKEWKHSLDGALKFSITDQVHSRTVYLLQGALKLVQIAIAQEAILAGEPLLPSLSKKWDAILQEKLNCKDVFQKEEFCFVRINPLMRANLLTYELVQRLGQLGDSEETQQIRRAKYENLLANKSELAQLLAISETRIKGPAGAFKIALSEEPILAGQEDSNIYVDLPSAEVLAKGQLQYTEGIARMIRLEHRLADELVKRSAAAQQQNYLAEALFIK